jgi:hypothetical protein
MNPKSKSDTQEGNVRESNVRELSLQSNYVSLYQSVCLLPSLKRISEGNVRSTSKVGQGGNLGLCSDHSCVDVESRTWLVPGTSGKTMERYIYNIMSTVVLRGSSRGNEHNTWYLSIHCILICDTGIHRNVANTFFILLSMSYCELLFSSCELCTPEMMP